MLLDGRIVLCAWNWSPLHARVTSANSFVGTDLQYLTLKCSFKTITFSPYILYLKHDFFFCMRGILHNLSPNTVTCFSCCFMFRQPKPQSWHFRLCLTLWTVFICFAKLFILGFSSHSGLRTSPSTELMNTKHVSLKVSMTKKRFPYRCVSGVMHSFFMLHGLILEYKVK